MNEGGGGVSNSGTTSPSLILINKESREDHKLVVNQEQLLLMQKEFSKNKVHQKDLILPDLNHNLHYHNPRRISVIKQRRVSLSNSPQSPISQLEFPEPKNLQFKRSASPVKTHQQRSSSTLSFKQQHRKYQSFHSPLHLEVSKRELVNRSVPPKLTKQSAIPIKKDEPNTPTAVIEDESEDLTSTESDIIDSEDEHHFSTSEDEDDEDIQRQSENAAIKMIKEDDNTPDLIPEITPQFIENYRGNLLFDASFESGNLERVIRVDENEYDLYIRGDTFSGGKRMWYYFKVSNVRKNQKVLFTITNLCKDKSLYRQGMTPLVSSTSRPRWERIPEKQVYYYKKTAKYNAIVNNSNLLSFVFIFDNEDDEYYFSYSFPYTYTDLQKFLFVIESKQLKYFHRSVLCRTTQNRKLDSITVTNILNCKNHLYSNNVNLNSILTTKNNEQYNSPSTSTVMSDISPSNLLPPTIAKNITITNDLTLENQSKKRIVFVTCRVHPGESPASYVCHGFISFIVSNHPAAVQLRDLLIFKIVPMLNPDGVAIGNYRCCSMGFDLNRHWLNPQEWSQPTIYHVRKYLLQLKNDPNFQVDFFLDLHSHSGANNGFMYVNYTSKTSPDDQLRFPKLLNSRAREFSMNDTKKCRDPSKMGASRRVLGQVLNVAKYCYTLEVSFFGYSAGTDTQPSSKHIPFSIENYYSLGKNMCLALADFYGLGSQTSDD